jgi:hypothetical protein
MSKQELKELFGDDSDDEEIVIPPMPKFKSKIERRGNIEEEIPEEIPEPDLLSFRSESDEESTDIFFFNEEAVEEAPKDLLTKGLPKKEKDLLTKGLPKKEKDLLTKGLPKKEKKEKDLLTKGLHKKGKKDKKVNEEVETSVSEFVEKIISEKDLEPCPPGKVRNPKTGRCIKEEKKKSK